MSPDPLVSGISPVPHTQEHPPPYPSLPCIVQTDHDCAMCQNTAHLKNFLIHFFHNSAAIQYMQEIAQIDMITYILLL